MLSRFACLYCRVWGNGLLVVSLGIGANEEREDVDLEQLNKIHFAKTGGLIEAAIITGGLIGKVSKKL